jgi:hypothetical protein
MGIKRCQAGIKKFDFVGGNNPKSRKEWNFINKPKKSQE